MNDYYTIKVYFFDEVFYLPNSSSYDELKNRLIPILNKKYKEKCETYDYCILLFDSKEGKLFCLNSQSYPVFIENKNNFKVGFISFRDFRKDKDIKLDYIYNATKNFEKYFKLLLVDHDMRENSENYQSISNLNTNFIEKKDSLTQKKFVPKSISRNQINKVITNQASISTSVKSKIEHSDLSHQKFKKIEDCSCSFEPNIIKKQLGLFGFSSQDILISFKVRNLGITVISPDSLLIIKNENSNDTVKIRIGRTVEYNKTVDVFAKLSIPIPKNAKEKLIYKAFIEFKGKKIPCKKDAIIEISFDKNIDKENQIKVIQDAVNPIAKKINLDKNNGSLINLKKDKSSINIKVNTNFQKLNSNNPNQRNRNNTETEQRGRSNDVYHKTSYTDYFTENSFQDPKKIKESIPKENTQTSLCHQKEILNEEEIFRRLNEEVSTLNCMEKKYIKE